MVFLDGLESSPRMSSWSTEALKKLREQARAKLEQLVPLDGHAAQVFDASFLYTSSTFRIGTFGIAKGPYEPKPSEFILQAPTTRDNARRLVRACQVSKPILLEGSPGVGKTSLVTALGGVAGHHVCRINLSDQTDLTDLFGSDLPAEGGQAGEFAWRDAAFLRAMQDGDWVLLDEMNLAPQAVLEGLNAVLDHRGTVFIPELGRSFEKHPRFRIFAAQNPLHQGGGRKGLPKSFVDRFTRVHIQTLSPEDLVLICQNLFPTLSADHLRSMIIFNFRLHEETMVKRSFGTEGSPWEFNLRDVMRWATLLVSSSDHSSTSHPSDYLDTLYLQRFRTDRDRNRTTDIFREVFELSQTTGSLADCSWASITPHHVQFGSALIRREDHCSVDSSVELQRHLQPLAAASLCIQKGWLMILSGIAGTGKTQLARYLAAAAGHRLCELSMSSGMDTMDLLGSFEQRVSTGNGSGRFEWIDGPLVEAVKHGNWVLLDNANLCNPSILDRLNSLCETDGLIVLTERGHVHGEVEILKPHLNFRLFLTVDPRNGELSRAMRNRAIEIHLPDGHTTLQDQLRMCDAIRIPPLSDFSQDMLIELTLQFDLVRRTHSRFTLAGFTSMLGPARCSQICHDSLASAMLDQGTFLQIECVGDPIASVYARTLFFVRMLAPREMLLFRRLYPTLKTLPSPWSLPIPMILFDGLIHQGFGELRRIIGERLAQRRRIPSSFILNQVSVDPLVSFLASLHVLHVTY